MDKVKAVKAQLRLQQWAERILNFQRYLTLNRKELNQNVKKPENWRKTIDFRAYIVYNN